MKSLTFVFALLGLTFFHGTALAAPVDISNILPTKLVQGLYEEQLWLRAFENPEAAETQDVLSFWNGISNQQPSVNDLVRQVFSGAGNNASFQQLPVTYPIKIFILRWLKAKAPTPRIAQIEKQILNQYFTGTITLIKTSQVPEMLPIVNQARIDIESGKFQLRDLSPALRAELLQKASPLHHDDAQILNKKNQGRYLVNGLFHPSQKFLAIDISRPFNETLITLAHEMVHMSDPELARARATVESLFPYVQAQLTQILGSTPNAESLAKALTMDVFHELGKTDVLDVLEKMRAKRLQSLEQNLQNAGLMDKTQDPKIREWIRALLSLTLENEIRAYLFSLNVYKQLKDQLQILPPSAERQRFIEQITEGNFNFARGLSAAMNPFNRESFASALVPASLQGQGLESLKQKVNYCKSILEHHYMTQTKLLLEGLGQKYQKQVTALRQEEQRSQSHLLPQWTQPGQFESPANPYIVITAKLSTIWVLRFKNMSQNLLADLQEMNSSLLSLHAGVLDLHDITFGELKLLGIHAPGADTSVLPKELNDILRKDLISVPGVLQDYFKKTQWNPTDFTGRNIIDQETLMTNLIRLRLLKSLYWLENSFPIARENIVSVKVLQLKIQEGFYDKEELTAERVQELKEQLVQALQMASASGVELKQMQSLYEMISVLYTVAMEQQWSVVANDFSRKLGTAIGLLQNMGLDLNFSKENFQKYVGTSITVFKKDLHQAYKSCRSVQGMYFAPSKGDFKLGPNSFPLTTICYNNKIYSFRQPGDYTKAATTMIKDGVPESRIFLGARPVRLSPLLDL